MNVKRGLIRLWVLFTVIWTVSLLWIGAPGWYNAASDWYKDVSDWYSGRVFHAHKRQKPTEGPWLTCPRGKGCFDVVAPNGSLYFVIAGDHFTEDEIASIAKNNPAKFSGPSCPTKPCKGGYGHDPILVDITGDEWFVVSKGRTPGLIFLGLAAGVPLALLGLGSGLWWVAMGFKAR